MKTRTSGDVAEAPRLEPTSAPATIAPEAGAARGEAEGERGPLSPRQRQILLLAAEGLTDRQIAGRIGLGEGTVRTYWERIRARLEARSRSEAIARVLGDEYRSAMEELARMRAILTALPQFVWTAQPSGEVDWTNDWFGRYSGRSVAEFLRSGCRALMPEGEIAASAARWREAQRTGRGYEADVHFESETGLLIPHRIRLQPLFDPGGSVQSWVGLAYPAILGALELLPPL